MYFMTKEIKGVVMPVEAVKIQNLIYVIRGKQVMIDSDLAALYQVETRRLNEAVKRNSSRFPERFCFQLTKEEYERGCRLIPIFDP